MCGGAHGKQWLKISHVSFFGSFDLSLSGVIYRISMTSHVGNLSPPVTKGCSPKFHLYYQCRSGRPKIYHLMPASSADFSHNRLGTPLAGKKGERVANRVGNNGPEVLSIACNGMVRSWGRPALNKKQSERQKFERLKGVYVSH
jgi:hypothetical protein